MPRRIGTPRTILATPFVEALARRSASGVDIVGLAPQQLAEELRQGNLDGAFVSPWEYTVCYATHRILPHAAVVSEGASGLIALLYREHVRALSRIAARTDMPTERALAQIVLAEKYEIRPVFEPLGDSWQEALGDADAVLVADVLARDTRDVHERIDLVDQWQDLTEFPFVHGFWIVRDEMLADWSLFAPPEEAPGETVARTVPLEADWNGLREFYRMAYYHGIINDLPDLRFLSSGQELS